MKHRVACLFAERHREMLVSESHFAAEEGFVLATGQDFWASNHAGNSKKDVSVTSPAT